MLDTIKLMMGISNTDFDDTINAYIQSAQLDLEQMGIDPSLIASGTDSLINSAIVSYCLGLLDIDNAELYQNTYRLQVDQLRHYGDYTV